ncbi:MAG: GNAT family N-acetyltransferase [Bacteroidales bacterium]|nr:GNAT family N-acetyltransferase [Bacteroidales bacterium]
MNIILRPFELADCKSIAKHANNRLIADNLRDRFPYPYTEMDAIQFIQIVSNNHPTTEFAIDIDGEAIGSAGIVLKEDIYRQNGEIGYWLSQDYWGKGIGTWVVGELVRKAFDRFKLHRVYAEVFEKNIASARILEKNGFVKEATLKNAIIKNGKHQNVNIFSALTKGPLNNE